MYPIGVVTRSAAMWMWADGFCRKFWFRVVHGVSYFSAPGVKNVKGIIGAREDSCSRGEVGDHS